MKPHLGDDAPGVREAAAHWRAVARFARYQSTVCFSPSSIEKRGA